MPSFVQFQWRVPTGGFEWVESLPDPERGHDRTALHLVERDRWPRRGDRPRQRFYNPLTRDTGLFHTFSTVELAPDAILAFANRYGVLGIGDEILIPGRSGSVTERRRGESLGDWITEITMMREAIAAWQAMGEPGTDVLGLQLQANHRLRDRVAPQLLQDQATGTLSLHMVPLNLAGAMWLQLAQAIAENKEFRACSECGRWFELHPRATRSDRMFCSTACRSRNFRERRKRESAAPVDGAGEAV